jgi:hypothetical protein
MHTLNFYTRFAPAVRSGKKNSSIRAKRLKTGHQYRLVTGQHTKTCEQLGIGTITSVSEVVIDWREIGGYPVIKVDGVVLTEKSMEQLAADEGFLDLGDMIQFFGEQYKLPFNGFLNRWVAR